MDTKVFWISTRLTTPNAITYKVSLKVNDDKSEFNFGT